MKCKYNYKFKKWYPVSLANKDAKIVTSVELQNRQFLFIKQRNKQKNKQKQTKKQTNTNKQKYNKIYE